MCRAEETKAVSKSQGLSPVGVVLENLNPESLVFAFTRQKLEERLGRAPFLPGQMTSSVRFLLAAGSSREDVTKWSSRELSSQACSHLTAGGR